MGSRLCILPGFVIEGTCSLDNFVELSLDHRPDPQQLREARSGHADDPAQRVLDVLRAEQALHFRGCAIRFVFLGVFVVIGVRAAQRGYQAFADLTEPVDSVMPRPSTTHMMTTDSC